MLNTFYTWELSELIYDETKKLKSAHHQLTFWKNHPHKASQWRLQFPRSHIWMEIPQIISLVTCAVVNVVKQAECTHRKLWAFIKFIRLASLTIYLILCFFNSLQNNTSGLLIFAYNRAINIYEVKFYKLWFFSKKYFLKKIP